MLNKDDIKNNLSQEEVYSFLAYLDAEPEIQGDSIISRTICHGGDSHKLYYYENTHLFHCFTNCGSFDIFELLVKINKVDNLVSAMYFVCSFFNIPIINDYDFESGEELKDWEIFKKYEVNSTDFKDKEQLKEYDKEILTYMPQLRIKDWEEEGITFDTIKYCNIHYDPLSCSIIIPHYDIDNRLVGIRSRFITEDDCKNGKYRPAYIKKQLYNHPLGFNLYNLNNSKDNISACGVAILFESEKATMQYMSFFGRENDISVACCGSSFIKAQFEALMRLGVKEIIIAFDKQFKKIGDDEWVKWTTKLKNIHAMYNKYVKISFLFDTENLLGYKDAPTDRGKEVFLELLKNKKVL